MTVGELKQELEKYPDYYQIRIADRGQSAEEFWDEGGPDSALTSVESIGWGPDASHYPSPQHSITLLLAKGGEGMKYYARCLDPNCDGTVRYDSERKELIQCNPHDD